MVGFHTRLGKQIEMDAFIRVIEEVLAPNGINTVIMEMSGYTFECFPEYSTGDVTKEDVYRVKAVCDKYGIRAIPLFSCLGHQSAHWPLFAAHPEFKENPIIPLDAKWPDIYCHSWCASNMDIYDYVFPMIDELIEVFQPEAFHLGLDEVFDIGEDCCPRCKGKDKAELFYHSLMLLYDHIKEKDIDVMMWGDRLLDHKKLGYQMWEADRFGMHTTFDKIPKDILICDWHYDVHDHGYPSTEQFIKGGFFDIPSFGHHVEQAKHFWGFCLEDLYMSRKFHWDGKLGGVLFTCWTAMTPQCAEEMILGAKGEYNGEQELWGKGSGAAIGETIATMAKACKNFRKIGYLG